MLSQTQVLGGGTCLNVASASAGGSSYGLIIDGSQFFGVRRRHRLFAHRRRGPRIGAQLKITDSKFEHLNNGGITLSTGADAAVGMQISYARS